MSSWIFLSEQVTSTVTTSVTFNSIPTTSGGKNLRDLVIVADVAAQAFDSWLGLRFNGDTGSNYVWVRGGSGGTASSQGTSQTQIQLYAHLTTTKGLWVTSVGDYARSDRQKCIVGTGGSTGAFGQAMTSGRWANNAAITSVTLFGGQGLEFASGARFTIYGIEA
jgi:hypothetical protein